MLRHVDPTRRAGPFVRAYAWLTATRLGRWLSRHIAWKLDPHLLRLTRGRIGLSAPIPTALLETRGARTGAVRRTAVIYFHDADRVTIVASLAGAPHHPAWFHNLRAHPDVVFGGEPMHATVVTDPAERERLWALADNVFPPFAFYRRRAGREIPIVQLASRR
jgi:deazaflavin-dependent oxidoreductase (nitroreductase family)